LHPLYLYLKHGSGDALAATSPCLEGDRCWWRGAMALYSGGTRPGDSLALSSSDAKWISIAQIPRFCDCLNEKRTDDFEEMLEWMYRVENGIHDWMVSRLFFSHPTEEAIARCRSFRALGRGWLIVQLSIPPRGSKDEPGRFKFWFEDVETVLQRKVDIEHLATMDNIKDLRPFTSGYIQSMELVFYIRGLFHPDQSGRKVPALSIKKWNPNFYLANVWHSVQAEILVDMCQKRGSVGTSEEERLAQSARSERNRRKRDKQKEREKAKKEQQKACAQAEADAQINAVEAPKRLAQSEDQQQFEQLLQEFSLEASSPGKR
jgi:hypothetical protein